MTVTVDDLAALRPFSEGSKLLSEAGREFIFLPGLKVRIAHEIKILDGLLRPGEIYGYTTRLFLSEKILEKGQNWNPFQILGRTWYSPSWQNVPAALPLPQMLVAHLAMYR